MLKLDIWLSKQLGYLAYNLNYNNLKKINFVKFKFKKILITIKSKAKINNTFLKKNKIKLITRNWVFFKTVNVKKNKIDKKEKEVRFANNLDKKSVLEISKKSLIKSRFYQDKKIKKELAKKIMQEWVLNFFKKKKNYYLIVSETNNKVSGFLLMLKKKNNYIIQSIAVTKKYRGQGLATKLLLFFENSISNKNKTKIFLTTQENNKEGLKFYYKNAFKVKYKKYIF